MPLYAHSLRTRPIALAAGKNYPYVITTLEPSDVDGSPGPEYDVTRELRGLSGAQQTALQDQVDAGDVSYRWSGTPEFSTGVVAPASPSTIPIYATEALRDASSPTEGQIAIVAGVEQHFINGAWRNPDGSST